MALQIFEPQNRIKLYIIGGVAGLVVLILMIVLLLNSFGAIQPAGKVTLQFWGVFDPPSYYIDAISAYQKLNPNISIIYQQFNYDDYERRLLNSFAAGTGPDIWLMHNTWLPKHGDKIEPMPQPGLGITGKNLKNPILTLNDFTKQFVEVAVDDLTLNGQIYALTLYVDTLALYYNRDIFNSAGIINPPATWDEFNEDIIKLTSLDQQGRILRAGAAMGTAKNINRSTDILSLLMLQSGVQMTDKDHTFATFSGSADSQSLGKVALQYYTDFANPSKQVFTWNDQQNYSIDAFVAGNTAMVLNYSHQTLDIRNKAPRFNFSVAPVPQINNSQTAVNFANYWAPTVSKQSKNALEAWKFLNYLSSADGVRPYINASSRPAARRELIGLQQNDPDLGVFATQALSARSWFQVDNNAIETIFANMIDDVNYSRASVHDALQTAESKINVLMQKNSR